MAEVCEGSGLLGVPGEVTPRHMLGPSPTPTIPYLHPLRPVARSRGVTWVPAGQSVGVAGKIIPGGLFYLGTGLVAATGVVEPALVDPALPLDRHSPDWDGDDLEPWPSYSTLSPASRAAYLTWLADGRRHPRAPIGYVLLFFYGLERRVLIDNLQHGTITVELPVIATEIRRLLGIYGANESLRQHASELLDLLAALRPGSDGQPPYGVDDRWPAPASLRAALGRFAMSRRPVPVEWALSWIWFHPAVYPRTPQTRCADEFRQLFAIRYREQFGNGLVVDADQPPVRLRYHPASSGLVPFDHDLVGVPDVLEDADATRALTALVATVTDELDAFSRYVGRNPDSRDSLAALALLPSELVSDTDGPAAPLLAWARDRLGRDASVVVDGAELIRFWPTAGEKMTGADVVACAQLLERRGIGLEPDPRLGGPVLGEGPAVLFEARGDMPRAAGPEYAVATTLLQLAVAVGGVDGEVLAVELDVMLESLRSALDLTGAEQERLTAHLHWLSVAGAKLTGLSRRVAALPEQRRLAIAEVLVAVAAADGVISPDEVEILIKIFGMLGLTADTLYSRLHAHSVDVPAIPARPAADRPQHAPPGRPAAPAPPKTSTPGVVALDAGVLAASAASTAAVSTLLGDIFGEDEQDEQALDTTSPDAEESLDGLDATHSRLLTQVLRQPRWTLADFAKLADSAGLMPLGAQDTLNEYAMDLCDDVLLETEDDQLVLNDFAVEAITR